MKYYLLTQTLYSFEADSDEEAIELAESTTDMKTESESFMTLTADGLKLVKDYQ
jgi:hypothetical protein